jgi:hypothetical protein
MGAVIEFNVTAHARIDVGTRKFHVNLVRKLWAVDTQQPIQVVILPKEKNDGSIVAEVRAEIVGASATHERHASESEATSFRDRVSNALRETLAGFSGEYDLKSVLRQLK